MTVLSNTLSILDGGLGVTSPGGKPVAIVDCFGILSDEKIRRYFELGCEVKGLGRGHVNRIKKSVKK